MTINQYKQNGENFWRVTVHVRSSNDRTRRIQKKLSNITSEKVAKREEKKLYREAIREMAIIDKKGLYWGDLVHLWILDLKEGLSTNAREKSIHDYKSMLRIWTSHWKDIQVSELCIADGKELIRNLSESGRSFAYQKKLKNIINRLFKWAIENRYIEKHISSPVQGLSIDKKEEKVPEILSLEEIKKLLSCAEKIGHKWYPVWTLALNTGMRSGELYALTWNQIDFEKNIILVHQSFDTFTKSVGPTKGRYWRVVPMSEKVRSFLIELKVKDIEKDGFVFPRLKTWKNGDQAVPLREFLTEIGLRSVKFHTLRACWATQMLANGVPAPIVMRIGGWKRSSTMDIYLRLAGVDVKGATDCLDFIPEVTNFDENVVNLFN